MGWVRNDDDMLDHEKWRRAIRDGGDGVLLVWMRLTSWCSRRLTDGEVPADMVDDVAEIGRSKSRAKALQALVDAQLLAWAAPGECTLSVRQGHGECTPRARQAHDALVVVGYLARNPCKASVSAERERRAEGQRNQRLRSNVPGSRGSFTSPPLHSRDVVPARPGPARPVPTPERELARAREPDPDPPPAGVTEVPKDWAVPEELYAEAFAVGARREDLDEEVRYWRARKSLGGEFRSVEEFFRTRLTRLAKRRETKAFARTRAGPDPLAAQAERVRMLREQEAREEAVS